MCISLLYLSTYLCMHLPGLLYCVHGKPGKQLITMPSYHRLLTSLLDSTYPITWCACSALYAVILKHLLQSFPYPLRITTAVVGTQLLYSLTKWILLPTKTRRPSFSKLRQRHWQRLIPAALAHGLGTIASHYTVQAGPITTCVLLKMLPYPLEISSVPIWFGAILSVRRIFHLVIGLSANLCFAVRYRIPISTRRFHCAQNVFEVTCALSFFIVVLPLTLVMEGLPNIVLLPDMMTKPNTTAIITSQQDFSYNVGFLLLLLGILYSLGNEMGALLSAPKHADLLRRMATWALAVMVLDDARRYQDVAGAMLVFGTQWWRNKNKRSSSAPDSIVVGNHQKQQHDLPLANRSRSFSADSYTTQGSLRTYNSLRSVPGVGPCRLEP
jgi:hypothetical protein